MSKSNRKKDIDIIYEDPDILVINKPPGVSVTADRSSAPGLFDLLSGQLGESFTRKLRLVHRLGKGASGLMVIAKSPEAQSIFSSYFQKRQVKKTYLAFVNGFVEQKSGFIRLPLSRIRRDSQKMQVALKKRGKRAVTGWRLLADFGPVSLLAVKPVTGRTHQIRVHLANADMPLAVDRLYANTGGLFLSEFKADYRLGRNKTEKPLISRLTLHAYQLEMPSEHNEKTMRFIAKPDDKFAATLKMLTKHNQKGRNAFIDQRWYSAILNGQPVNLV